MIRANCQTVDGYSQELRFPLDIALRDLQQPLCKAFGKRFPAMQANVQIGNLFYDDFIQKPFADSAILADARDINEELKITVLVTFQPTTDPFWFDWYDRCDAFKKKDKQKYSIETNGLVNNTPNLNATSTMPCQESELPKN